MRDICSNITSEIIKDMFLKVSSNVNTTTTNDNMQTNINILNKQHVISLRKEKFKLENKKFVNNNTQTKRKRDKLGRNSRVGSMDSLMKFWTKAGFTTGQPSPAPMDSQNYV